MAVKELEDEVKNIDGISSMATTITPGKFSIYLELEKRVDKYATADKVKDAVAIAQQNLPNDMDEPVVRVLEMRRVLLNIALLSKGVTHDELIKKSEDLKDKLSSIKNVTEVIIYGNSDIYFDIKINTNKLKALNLDEKLVANSISKLSYIFPIGMIEDSTKGHYYISTFNGKKDALSMENTLLQIGDKKVYLKDIATIKKRYADASTMYSVDTKNAIDVSVKQSEEGNAIEIAKEIDKLVKELNKNEEKISYVIHNDHSTSIKDRLNIIVSNILLGITLIALLVMLLINTRMSFVITLGIPTSFVMGAFYLYISGYSINMISLVGVLIALGIIVDDAIVVSENIQQHLEEGKSPRDAAMQGASEMFKPVTIASITTLFAFIPSLMMSGTMGEVIKLIPIAVSVLVLASLVESFIFLPIHAAHLLKKDSPVQSWERVNRIYSKIIHLFIKFRKTSLLLFIVLIPLLIVLGIKASKFQMFPTFDASSVNISLKADVNTKVEDTDKILKLIEQDIYENKDRFYIDHVGAVAGWRIDGAMKSENYPYVGMLTLELHKLKAQNFVDKFITS
jgi:multidrug efflux pump subunit AcrB